MPRGASDPPPHVEPGRGLYQKLSVMVVTQKNSGAFGDEFPGCEFT
jgi:hypothetical protein